MSPLLASPRAPTVILRHTRSCGGERQVSGRCHISAARALFARGQSLLPVGYRQAKTASGDDEEQTQAETFRAM